MDIPKPPDRQCTATNRKGERCRRAPIPGGFVCKLHGGGAPQVKAKAQERLAALVMPAIATLGRAMKAQDLAGQPLPVAVRAAAEILDRAGLDLENKSAVAAGTREVVIRFDWPADATQPPPAESTE